MPIIQSSTLFVSVSLVFLPILILLVVLCLPFITFVIVGLYISAWVTSVYSQGEFDIPCHPVKVIKVNLALANQIWCWIRSLPTLISYVYWRYWRIEYKQFKEIISVDIQYSSTGCLDVYRPDKAKAPIIVFIYGDSWFPRSKFLYRTFANTLRELGYVVVVPDYQKHPALNDAREVIQWVYRNSKDIGGNPDRIFMMGHSSGAHLITQVVIADIIEKAKYHHAMSHVSGKHDPTAIQYTKPDSYLPRLEGLLLFSGIYDNRTVIIPDSDKAVHKSPIQLIEDNVSLFADSENILDLWPRVMLLHGQKDTIISMDQSVNMFNVIGKALPTEHRDETDIRLRFYKHMNHEGPLAALMPSLSFKTSLKKSLIRDIKNFVDSPSFE